MQTASTRDFSTTTPTTVSSVHESANIPGNVTHDVISPLSHVVSAQVEQSTHAPVDIEHVVVQDDPRQWSMRRKTFTLAIIAAASLICTLGVNIYNRPTNVISMRAAINDIKQILHATDKEISLSLSIFIVVQGSTPLLWSAISEIHGRKLVYLSSISLYLIGCGVAASAKTTAVLIAMRIVQAWGGSAVLTIGAATLADIYEPRERGTMVGIYYAAPLLGPSIGPLIGGVLTQLFSWRATFYFLLIFAGIELVTFALFKDTFRRERSLSYQAALCRATKERDEKLKAKEKLHGHEDEKRASADLEAQPSQSDPTLEHVQLSLRDVNPIPPLGFVLKRRNNLVILFPSALLFGFTYCITYTAVRTFAAPPYSYDALVIGLVLLSFGIGSMGGSVIGGRWSDHVLTKLKAVSEGKTSSEDRLQSTKPMMLVLPLALVAYAWMAEEKVHIAGVCVALFLIGFSSIWIYSSTLAYIVDANAGRSSTAVATNSFFRGLAGFVAAELAVPLQDALGDGGLYTLWAGLMVLTSLLILLTIAKGAQWRELAEVREWKKREIK